MDGRDTGGLGSYFNTHHHHHLVDSAASPGFPGKGIFSVPSSASGDANPFAIPHTLSARPAQPRPAATAAAESAKRKRGRPRKYGALPSLSPLSQPTSAMSAVANASPSLLRPSPSSSSRKKESSASSSSKKSQLAALGNAGHGFTPHVIAVSAGEDLVNKLVSMMQQGKRTVCILSATGSILNPSLRQSASSGAYVTHEGMFEIISLFGSLIHTKPGGTPSRSCGLGICLSGVDGRIVGGGVEGPLMAAGPIQVIAGSFLIDIDMNSSASTKVDCFMNKMSTEASAASKLNSPISMESTLGSSRRMTTQGSDEDPRVGGGYHLFHPRPMFSSPEWEAARHISGPAGTNQSADDEDDEYIQN